MSRQKLIDFQNEVLAALTDPDVFARRAASHEVRLPHGVDIDKVRVVGRLAFSKRIRKIKAVLPWTFHHLRGNVSLLLEDFGRKYPPHSASRYDNAAQFTTYLGEDAGQLLSTWPFLPDLAACELAIAQAQQVVAPSAARYRHTTWRPDALIRRAPHLGMVRCRFDVQRLLSGEPREPSTVEKRPVSLLVLPPTDVAQVRVFEVSPDIYQLLADLHEWSRIGELIEPPPHILGNLLKLRVIEVGRPCVSA